MDKMGSLNHTKWDCKGSVAPSRMDWQTYGAVMLRG